jgi:hypothetical protein
MNPISDYPKFPVTLLLHAAGVTLFVVALYLLGLTLADIYASFWKLTGAAIFFFGCDELAFSGWRSWRRWRLGRPAQAS